MYARKTKTPRSIVRQTGRATMKKPTKRNPPQKPLRAQDALPVSPASSSIVPPKKANEPVAMKELHDWRGPIADEGSPRPRPRRGSDMNCSSSSE